MRNSILAMHAGGLGSEWVRLRLLVCFSHVGKYDAGHGKAAQNKE